MNASLSISETESLTVDKISNNTYIYETAGKVILRQTCTSPVSASVGFHAACKRAYLALLDGSLTAWDVVFGSDVRSSTTLLPISFYPAVCGFLMCFMQTCGV